MRRDRDVKTKTQAHLGKKGTRSPQKGGEERKIFQGVLLEQVN